MSIKLGTFYAFYGYVQYPQQSLFLSFFIVIFDVQSLWWDLVRSVIVRN